MIMVSRSSQHNEQSFATKWISCMNMTPQKSQVATAGAVSEVLRRSLDAAIRARK